MSPAAKVGELDVFYQAAEAFDVAGRLVAKGERMERNDPDVNIVLKAHPGLLLVRVLRKEA